MSLRTQYEFLFVGREEGAFVENYAYDLGEGGEHSGKIFINLEIQNNPVDAERIGESIFDILRRAFFADLDSDPYQRFEVALKEINKELRLFRKEKNGSLGNINSIIGAIVGNNLYVTQAGEAEAYLIRRRFCSVISEDLSDPNSEDLFTNIANGTLEVDDFVLFSTTRILRYMTKTDLARVGSGKNLVSMLADLRDFLSTELLNKVGFIALRGVSETPDVPQEERGQVMAHLRKEEEYEANGVRERQTVNATFNDIVKKVSGSLGGLKEMFGSRKPGNRGRMVRGSSYDDRDDGKGGFNLRNLSKEKLLALIIVVVLVLAGGVWWLRSRADEQAKISQYQAILDEVQQGISNAETNGTFDKESAATMLNEAEKQAVTVLNSGVYRAKATELLRKIQESRDRLDGVVRIQPRVMVDLSTKRSNVNALGLLALKNDMFAFEYNALYPMQLDQLKDPLTIDENETVIAATAYADKNSLLFYTSSGRVIEYKDNRMTFVQSDEATLKKGIAVQSYSNKFYVLSPEDNQIYRYTRGKDKFGTSEKYNVDGDLKNAISFAIDSNVYVLNKDGSIVKLLRGNKQELTLKKQPINAMANPTKIFTHVEGTQVYILEPDKNRVMVFYKNENTKSLDYATQYVFDEINDVRDLYVDPDGKNLYLIDQSRVYQVAL